jgi:hypothetical protein
MGLYGWRPEDVDVLAQQLEGRTVVSAAFDESTVLKVTFDNGLVVECPPDDRFEAWQVSVRPGEATFALAGGGWSGFPLGR